jgi:hypothetical protein
MASAAGAVFRDWLLSVGPPDPTNPKRRPPTLATVRGCARAHAPRTTHYALPLWIACRVAGRVLLWTCRRAMLYVVVGYHALVPLP